MAQVAQTYLAAGFPAQLAIEIAAQITADTADVPKLIAKGMAVPAANEFKIQMVAGASPPTNPAERLMGVGFSPTQAVAIVNGIAAETP